MFYINPLILHIRRSILSLFEFLKPFESRTPTTFMLAPSLSCQTSKLSCQTMKKLKIFHYFKNIFQLRHASPISATMEWYSRRMEFLRYRRNIWISLYYPTVEVLGCDVALIVLWMTKCFFFFSSIYVDLFYTVKEFAFKNQFSISNSYTIFFLFSFFFLGIFWKYLFYSEN